MCKHIALSFEQLQNNSIMLLYSNVWYFIHLGCMIFGVFPAYSGHIWEAFVVPQFKRLGKWTFGHPAPSQK